MPKSFIQKKSEIGKHKANERKRRRRKILNVGKTCNATINRIQCHVTDESIRFFFIHCQSYIIPQTTANINGVNRSFVRSNFTVSHFVWFFWNRAGPIIQCLHYTGHRRLALLVGAKCYKNLCCEIKLLQLCICSFVCSFICCWCVEFVTWTI